MNPVDAILRYPLFALLGRPIIETWASVGQPCELTTGSVLLEACETGKYVYLVQSGRVRATRAGYGDQERTVAFFGPGAVFGDYALIPPHVNTATCRASEPCRVFRLPLDVLRCALRNVSSSVGHLKNWLRLHA